jgi:hypothetical protein
MPYTIRKVPRKKCFTLRKKTKKGEKKRVFAKCTTKTKARAQMRLLNAIEHNPSFVPVPKKTRKTK